jgi:hypothetical protein
MLTYLWQLKIAAISGQEENIILQNLVHSHPESIFIIEGNRYCQGWWKIGSHMAFQHCFASLSCCAFSIYKTVEETLSSLQVASDRCFTNYTDFKYITRTRISHPPSMPSRRPHPAQAPCRTSFYRAWTSGSTLGTPWRLAEGRVTCGPSADHP